MSRARIRRLVIVVAVLFGLGTVASAPALAATPQSPSRIVPAQPGGPPSGVNNKATVQPMLGTGLPFTYSVSFSRALASRNLYTSDGTVCNASYISSVSGSQNVYWVQLKRSSDSAIIGSTGQYPTGGWYHFCWTGVSNYTDYYLYFYKAGDGYTFSGTGQVYQ